MTSRTRAAGGVDVLALPFDQYQRYRLVSDLLEEVRAKKQRFRVLDVGGRTGLLRSFLPKDDVALVDLEPSGEAGLVLGDGSKLPFRDKCFDVVAAFDTLEHVPPASRDAFVSECARVAKSWVFLAGPYRSPEVDEAETILQRFLLDKLGLEHRYLEEHRHHGLPVLADTAAVLEKSGAVVAHVGHGNLERWLALMCMAMYLDHEPRLRPLAARLFRFYNAGLYASDHAPPVYRHALIGAFAGAKLPAGEAGLAAPIAPRGALEGFREVAEELVGFDRAREDWREERARLAQILATLERDLAGHRAALDEERERGAEGAQVIATLESDLSGHRTSLTAISKELEIEREQGARMRAALEADLQVHRSTLTTLERVIESHRAVQTELQNRLEQHEARSADLEADLAGHRRALAEACEIVSQQATALADQRASIERLGADVHERESRLAALEARQRDERREHAALQREIDALRAEYAASIAAYEKRIADHRTLEGEQDVRLREHKVVIEDLRADLEGHRGLARDLRAEIEAVRAEQARVMDELRRTQQDVAGKRAEITAAAAALSQNDALIGELRAHLKDRWKSLKRALGPRKKTPGEA